MFSLWCVRAISFPTKNKKLEPQIKHWKPSHGNEEIKISGLLTLTTTVLLSIRAYRSRTKIKWQNRTNTCKMDVRILQRNDIAERKQNKLRLCLICVVSRQRSWFDFQTIVSGFGLVNLPIRQVCYKVSTITVKRSYWTNNWYVVRFWNIKQLVGTAFVSWLLG